MKIVSLNNTEAAATGFTHIINIKVANGDLNVIDEIQNVMPVLPGFWVKDCALDIRTAWDSTLPTISVGVNDSGLIDNTDLLTATNLDVSGVYTGSSTGVVVNAASQYITIARGGTGTATVGEANLLLKLVDLRLGRVTFSN